MRWRFTLDDALLVIAFAALGFLRNWQAAVFCVAVLAYVVIQHLRNPLGENGFLISRDEHDTYTAELDVGLDRRKLPNHFRTNYQGYTYESKSLYEYRLEGTEVFHRLITEKNSDIGDPEHFDVRDGVVLRKRAESRSEYGRTSMEDRIASFKNEVEWSKMTAMSWHGLKYFIISKKLPKADARRYLRQELERLKVGTAGFFKEAEKYGLVQDESSLERFKVADGKLQPSAEEYKKLNESAKNVGITDVEFSWGKKLCEVLEKLLGD